MTSSSSSASPPVIEDTPLIVPEIVFPAAPLIGERMSAPTASVSPSVISLSGRASVGRPDPTETLEQALQRAIDDMESPRRATASQRGGAIEAAQMIAGGAIRDIGPLATLGASGISLEAVGLVLSTSSGPRSANTIEAGEPRASTANEAR